MHFARSGSTLAQLAAADPGIVRYVQVSDTRLTPWAGVPAYIEEARFERLVPGEGEVPIAGILALAPRDLTVGVEVPRRALAQRGASVRELIEPAVEAARALLAKADAATSATA
jgi:hypothetical protein